MTYATDGATVLGVVDDWEYLGVEWVFRRPAGDTSTTALDYYCTRQAWPATPAAQLAARDQIIRDLRAQVAELADRLAAVVVPPSVAEAATGMQPKQADEDDAANRTCWCGKRCRNVRGLKTHQRLMHGEESAEPVECPACHETFKNAAGLAIHRSNCPAAGPALIPLESLEIDGWRCVVCGSNAFAPGLRDITICMRCEGTAHRNGKAIEAAA
jgi:hypothetical protein